MILIVYTYLNLCDITALNLVIVCVDPEALKTLKYRGLGPSCSGESSRIKYLPLSEVTTDKLPTE